MNKEQLEKEIHFSEKAAKAYTLWVMNYIDTQKVMVFNSFMEAGVDEYPYIHAMVDALYNMESAIKADIETGDLARKQLEKGE